jgi:hypothetical protein
MIDTKRIKGQSTTSRKFTASVILPTNIIDDIMRKKPDKGKDRNKPKKKK